MSGSRSQGWSDWTPLVRRHERGDDPGLPIKLGPCSNGEFAPIAPSPTARRAVRLAREACEDAARRIGMSRRDFLRTSMASAATLLALGACSGDEEPSAGTFDLPPESTTEPDVATSVLGGDGRAVVDVQQHLLELEGFEGSFGSGFPQAEIMTPPSHILGLLNIATVLDAGAWMRLHPRFDIDRMLAHIQDDRITIEMAVAPIALAIAAHPDLESYDLSSLRYIMWCATPVTKSVADTVTDRVGVPWVSAYGASELPVIACCPIGEARLDTVGKPVPGVSVRIAEDGEIQVRSDSAMVGYLPDDATAAAFDDGWFRTGDIGELDSDGWLRITDRLKEMIKVRGFQVAPAEVEAVLHGHPAVEDCAVFGVPDGVNGEAVVAAVTAEKPVTEAELIALVGERLSSYKRPSRVVFVDAIPRLPSGKVLRRVLRDDYRRADVKGPESNPR